MILLRGIQLTNVQRYWGSTVKIVFSYEIFNFHEANTRVVLPNDQLLKPLNKRELYTT
jgi:hypothetical protein